MSEIFERMKWEDIYSYWQVSSEKYMHALNPPHSSCNIEVKRNSQNRIYSYLWIRNDQIKQVSAELNGYAESTRFSTKTILPNEAVLRAADLMIQSKSDEERAAIWIWIFCCSLENATLPYPNSLYLDYVGAKVRLFLQEQFQEWVFRYQHRFPHLFINSEILKKVKFERYSIIVDFAIMNAFMLCKEYAIVLFDSEPEKNELPFSYHDLRKE